MPIKELEFDVPPGMDINSLPKGVILNATPEDSSAPLPPTITPQEEETDYDLPTKKQNALNELDGLVNGYPKSKPIDESDDALYYRALTQSLFESSPELFKDKDIPLLANIEQQSISVTKKMLDDAYAAKNQKSTFTFMGLAQDLIASATPKSMTGMIETAGSPGIKTQEEEEIQRDSVRVAVEALGGYTKAKEHFENNGLPFPAHPVLLTPAGKYLRELQEKHGHEVGTGLFLSEMVPEWMNQTETAKQLSGMMMKGGTASRMAYGVFGVLPMSGYAAFVRPIRGLVQTLASVTGEDVLKAKMAIPSDLEAVFEKTHELNREWYADLRETDWVDRTTNKLGEMSYDIAQGTIEAAAHLKLITAVTGHGYGQALGPSASFWQFAKATGSQSTKFALFKVLTDPGTIQERLAGGMLAFLYNMTPVTSREFGGLVGHVLNSKAMGKVTAVGVDIASNILISDVSQNLYREAFKTGFKNAQKEGLGYAECMAWGMFQIFSVCPMDVLPAINTVPKKYSKKMSANIERLSTPEVKDFMDRLDKELLDRKVKPPPSVKTQPTPEDIANAKVQVTPEMIIDSTAEQLSSMKWNELRAKAKELKVPIKGVKRVDLEAAVLEKMSVPVVEQSPASQEAVVEKPAAEVPVETPAPKAMEPITKPTEGEYEPPRPYQADEQLTMRSPFTNEDTVVNYRGPIGADSAVVWTGKTQITVKNSWLRREGESIKVEEPSPPSVTEESSPPKAEVNYPQGVGPTPLKTVLPAELAKASPRYGYQDKQFEVQFESDIDKAAYITAQSKKSKRDADYLKFAMEATGKPESGVRAMGAEIRAKIKEMAKTTDAPTSESGSRIGKIMVPATATAPAPKAEPPAPAPVKSEMPAYEPPELVAAKKAASDADDAVSKLVKFENSMAKKDLYKHFGVKNKEEYKKFRDSTFGKREEAYQKFDALEKELAEAPPPPPVPKPMEPAKALPPYEIFSEQLIIKGLRRMGKEIAEKGKGKFTVKEVTKFVGKDDLAAAAPYLDKLVADGLLKKTTLKDGTVEYGIAGWKEKTKPAGGIPKNPKDGKEYGDFVYSKNASAWMTKNDKKSFDEYEGVMGRGEELVKKAEKAHKDLEAATKKGDKAAIKKLKKNIYEMYAEDLDRFRLEYLQYDREMAEKYASIRDKYMLGRGPKPSAAEPVKDDESNKAIVDKLIEGIARLKPIGPKESANPKPAPQEPPKPMEDGSDRPQTLEDLTRMMEEISPGEMSREKADALATIVRGIAGYVGMTPDQYVRYRFEGILNGGEPSLEALYKTVIGAKVKNRQSMEDYFSKHPMTKDDNKYFSESIKHITRIAGRKSGESAVRSNQKTILSIDISADCPMKQMGFACLQCYNINPQAEILEKAGKFINKTMPEVKLGLMELGGDNHVRYQDDGVWKDFGSMTQAIKNLRAAGVKVGSQTPATSYRGAPYESRDIVEMPQPTVDFFNSIGGLRCFSNGDFEKSDIATLDKIVADAAKRGLQIKVITKQRECVERYAGKKNVSFNLSIQFTPRFADSHYQAVIKGLKKVKIIGEEAERAWGFFKGVIEENQVAQGWNEKEAVELKKKYPKQIRLRYVAMNRGEYIASVADPNYDVITMYHGPTNPNTMYNIWKTSKAHEFLFKSAVENGVRPEAIMAFASMFEASKPKALAGGSVTQKQIDKILGEGKLTEEQLVTLAEKKTCCVDGACGRCTVLCGFADSKRVKDGLAVLGKFLDGQARASVEFDSDNRALVRAFQSVNVADMSHEIAHIFRRDLVPEDMKIAEEWAGVKEGFWDRGAEEKWALGFEGYLAKGEAPTPALKSLFQRFKQWMVEIYGSIKNGGIDIKLSPQVKDLFDRLITGTRPTSALDTAPQLSEHDYSILANNAGGTHLGRWLGGKGGWFDEYGKFNVGEPVSSSHAWLAEMREEMTQGERESESPATTWENWSGKNIAIPASAPREGDALESGVDEHGRVTMEGSLKVLYKQGEVAEAAEQQRPDVRFIEGIGMKVKKIKQNARKNSTYIDISPPVDLKESRDIVVRFSDHAESIHTKRRFHPDIYISVGEGMAGDPKEIEKALRTPETLNQIRKAFAERVAQVRVIDGLNANGVPKRDRGYLNRALDYLNIGSEDPTHPLEYAHTEARLLQMPMQHHLRILEGRGFEYAESALSWLHGVFHNAHSNEVGVTRVVTEVLEKGFEGMPKDYSTKKFLFWEYTRKKDLVSVRDQGEYTKLELISLYLMSKDSTNRRDMMEHGVKTERLLASKPVKFTNEMMADVESAIMADDKLFAATRAIEFALPYMADRINPVSMRLMGRPIATNKNYWMAMREKAGIKEEWDAIGTPSDMANAQRIVDLFHQTNNLQARQDVGGVVMVQNPINAMNRYTRAVARYVAYAEAVENARGIFASQNLKEYMRDHFPSNVPKYINEYIDDVAAGGSKRTGRESDKKTTIVFNWFNNQLVSAGLQWNLRAASYQVVSYSTARYVMPSEAFKAGVSELPESIAHMSKYSDLFWERFRSDSAMVGEFTSDRSERTSVGWKPIYHMDALTIGAVWNGCRSWIKSENASLSGDALEYATAKRAEWVISMTQPTQDPADRASLARSGNPLVRSMLVLFSSQRNQNYGLHTLHQSVMYDRTVNGDYLKPGGGALIKEDAARVFYGRVVQQVAIAILATAGSELTRAFLKATNIFYADQEDDEKFLAGVFKNTWMNIIGDLGMIPSFLARVSSGYATTVGSGETLARLKNLYEAMGLKTGERKRDDKYGLEGTDKADHTRPVQAYAAGRALGLLAGSGIPNLVIQVGGLAAILSGATSDTEAQEIYKEMVKRREETIEEEGE